jgi:hypothetical protein
MLAWSATLRVNQPLLFGEHVIESRRRPGYELPEGQIVLYSKTSRYTKKISIKGNYNICAVEFEVCPSG